ncbi:MAG: flagellar type III secretion system pore protein FliP [Phycisphaerales bacterium]|jgi:flagellar biosynthetic protein FliP|nr:flagellar type III secretion system pore protein FliP [Phycisphaerales bacterium]
MIVSLLASGVPENPIAALEQAGQLLPGGDGTLGTTVNILLLLTVLALVPSILVLCTCFTRFVVVLALLRQALGSPVLPPTQILVGLSLLLTVVVMAPTLERMYDEGLRSAISGEVTDTDEAWKRTSAPLREFMFSQIEAAGNWSTVYMMLNYRGVDTSKPEELTQDDVDTLSLIPAYVLSELKIAFLIGFKVYLPFLVIDLLVSSLLVSMGMLMLPPVLVSLPFKVLLFVLVDGWQLVVGNLLQSIAAPTEVAVVLMSGGFA